VRERTSRLAPLSHRPRDAARVDVGLARVAAQARVTAFDVMRASCTEIEAHRTLEHRRAIRIERAENASGSCVAAKGEAMAAAAQFAREQLDAATRGSHTLKI
jgi:hypothetical protein